MNTISKTLTIMTLTAMAASTGFADPNPSTNEWGKLTKEAIEEGFEQGAHSSDPSGDGHGPGTNDEPRKGLANVVERGNLGATVDLISGL